MYDTKRRGFAMILAIFVVLLVAMGGALLLRNSATSNKSVGDNYLRAQAELLAESATEFGVMRAQGFNHAGGNCLNQLNISVYNSNGAVAGNEMFDINISLAYSFRNSVVAGFNDTCTRLDDNTSKDTMILMDVTVTDHNLSTEPIRVHKRTWQKL